MELSIKRPEKKDGKEIWKLIKRTGTLDLNSEYSYFMLSDLFEDHCAIIVSSELEEVLGFVSTFRRKGDKETVFVWQICVDERLQGQGAAKRMLDFIIQKSEEKVQYVEATISDDNGASIGLFSSFARGYGAEMKKETYIDASEFEGSHDSEYLYKIGPLIY